MRRLLYAMMAAALLGLAGLTVWLLQSGPGAPGAIPLQAVHEGVSLHRADGVQVFLLRRGHSVRAFLNRSPHLGEPLWYCVREGVFVSPAHGELFDAAGRYVDGPAPRGLDRVQVRVEGDDVLVNPRVVERGAPVSHGEPRGAIPADIAASYRAWNLAAHPERIDFCRMHVPA